MTDVCALCGEDRARIIKAPGHDEVHHEAKAETCITIGWDAYETCTRCDYTTYVEIPALGHDYIYHDAQAVTCTEIGWNAYKSCSRCDYSTYVEIPAEHNYIHHTAKEPSCTIGWEAYDTCSRCDYTTYVEIPIKDPYTHNVKNGACIHCGLPESTPGLEYSQNADGTYKLTDTIHDEVTRIVIGIYNNKSVTTIGNRAFEDCTSLTSVVIPAGVTTIGNRAFYDCTSLTSVYYKGTADEWANISMDYNNDLTSAPRYYYIENEADVPADGGKYWHYDGNGNITVW